MYVSVGALTLLILGWFWLTLVALHRQQSDLHLFAIAGWQIVRLVVALSEA